MKFGTMKKKFYFIFPLSLLAMVIVLSVIYGPVMLAKDIRTMCMDFAARIFANVNDQPTRALISRIRTDQRAIAIALEAYYVDNDAYPAERSFCELNREFRSLEEMRGMALSAIEPGRAGLSGLTTPIQYMSSLLEDPYSTRESRLRFYFNGKLFTRSIDKNLLPYAYERLNETSWILYSAGPDRDYDLRNMEELMDGEFNIETAFPRMVDLLYDPTNGTTSNGDLFRLKQ